MRAHSEIGSGPDLAALENLLRSAAASPGGVPFAPGLSLRELLDRCETSHPRAYFESHEADRETLGLGVAQVHAPAPATASEILGGLPAEGTWIGGLRFDPRTPASPDWEAFGAAWFLRPRVRLTRDAHGFRLHFENDGAGALREAVAILGPLFALSEPRNKTDSAAPLGTAEHGGADSAWTLQPTESRWPAAFAAAKQALDDGRLKKVVLAHKTHGDLARPPRLGEVLSRSAEISDQAFRFALSVDARNAFFGASPELLLRANDGRIETEALAGTRPTAARDEMLTDDKELHEHSLVVDAIRTTLGQAEATSIEEDGPIPRAHGSISHLATRFHARIRGSARQLAGSLHPTPAVCGTPREEARRFVREHEGFDRGFYAGVVGTISGEDLELAVALRSARVHDREATIFAGGGIVAGSREEDEARELEQKSALWRTILSRVR